MKAILAHRLRYFPHILTTLIVALVVVGLLRFIKNSTNTPVDKKFVQQITLIAPPPPPPPPKIEQPPEPQVQEEIKAPEPEPQPDANVGDDTPPGEDLALDALGGAGGDAFNLLGKKGGRDLLGDGGRAWFSQQLKSELYEFILNDATLKNQSFNSVVLLWFDAEGNVTRSEISAQSTRKDFAVKELLARFKRITIRIPENTPQPVKVRIQRNT